MHGLDHELLDAAEVTPAFPAIELPDGYSAIWQPEGGILRPELANALHLRLAKEAGATVLTNAKVARSNPAAQRSRVA